MILKQAKHELQPTLLQNHDYYFGNSCRLHCLTIVDRKFDDKYSFSLVAVILDSCHWCEYVSKTKLVS